ncbi:MAG TPA: nucleotidyltransferase domain-containing protein [Pseudomonadota bacterium]|nr:nucleotidyltransferase domain-containing protein [Pseudomonadota bacterium]
MKRAQVDPGILLLVRAGSHAYGTSLPTSDIDLRGVFVPPRDHILGLRRVEQYEERGSPATATQPEQPDLVVYELRKYMALAADANPNILEIVFVEEGDVLQQSESGRKLRAHRHLFLSKKAKYTFSGYATAQLKRIESHRRWLLHPPSAPPQRRDFGLPERTIIPKDQLAAAEALIRKQVAEWENTLPTFGIDVTDSAALIELRERMVATLTAMGLASDEARLRAAGRTIGLDDNFIELLDREHKYAQKSREWDSYRKWCDERNETRAELERRHGYDTKHGMHLVRLMRMCREILTLGEIRVRRPDAAELLSIRAGAWSYERLLDFARQQEAELSALYQTCTLPHTPDHERINELCCELIEAQLWGSAHARAGRGARADVDLS